MLAIFWHINPSSVWIAISISDLQIIHIPKNVSYVSVKISAGPRWKHGIF